MLDPPPIASRLNGVASSPVRDLLALTQQPHYPGLESHPQHQRSRETLAGPVHAHIPRERRRRTR